MPQTTMAKLSGIIASGRLRLAAFKYWLTRNNQWKKQDPAGVLCKSFCPICKYYKECSSTLKRLEEL